MRRYPEHPRVGIGVVLLRGEDVLQLRRGRPPAVGAWSLPGGGLELGERAEDCARRELLEETGLESGALRLIGHVDAIHYDDEQRIEYHYTILDFGALYVGGEAVAGDDVTEVAWVREDEFNAYGLWDEARRMIAQARVVLG